MVPVPNNTKERLVTTAMDLIWKSSYGSVSVDGICKAADVKKGSFYHFFPSKISLAVAALEEAFDEFRPMLDEVFSPVNTPIERFEKYVEMGVSCQKDITEQYGMVCGCPFISLGSEMAPQDESIRQKTYDIIVHHKKYYELTLRDMVANGDLNEDVDVTVIADQIYAYIMGQFVMARISNNLDMFNRDFRSGVFRIIGIEDNS